LVSFGSFGQTGIYSSNGVLTIETPVVTDVLLGYPTGDVLDSRAIEEYKILIKMSPQNPEGYYGLANVYQTLSKLDLALSNAFIALELYKQNPTNYIGDSYAQIGLIYYYMGNKSKAKEYIQIAKEKYISNNLESYFNSTFPKSMIKELSID
jgi:tetratricopeptide (TPR) repeat protein